MQKPELLVVLVFLVDTEEVLQRGKSLCIAIMVRAIVSVSLPTAALKTEIEPVSRAVCADGGHSIRRCIDMAAEADVEVKAFARAVCALLAAAVPELIYPFRGH